MKHLQVPYCCGLDFLYGFYADHGNGDSSINKGSQASPPWAAITTEDVEKWIVEEIENTIRVGVRKYGTQPLSVDRSMRPLKLLIINTSQKQKGMDKLLEKLGFNEIFKTKNPKTRGWLYFYFKDVQVDIQKKIEEIIMTRRAKMLRRAL